MLSDVYFVWNIEIQSLSFKGLDSPVWVISEHFSNAIIIVTVDILDVIETLGTPKNNIIQLDKNPFF